MSRRAEALVWERSRAGKTALLALVKIADLADDDGRNAWPEVPALARWLRASERAALYILHRLQRTRELEIELNEAGRSIELRSGRRFSPKWFLHVRCVCEWNAYQKETGKEWHRAPAESAIFAGFPRGRTSRKGAKIADSVEGSAQSLRSNPKRASEECEKTRTTYKEGSVSDPVVEQVQGAAPPIVDDADEGHGDEWDEKRDNGVALAPPDDNLSVITKLAHEVLDFYPHETQLGELATLLKIRCLELHIDSGQTSELVRKAIDSARHQRQLVRGRA